MNEFIAINKTVSAEIKIIDSETVLVNNQLRKFSLVETGHNKFLLKVDNNYFEAVLLSNRKNEYNIGINERHFSITVLTNLQEKALKLIQVKDQNELNHTVVRSPMPGMVLKVNKKAGEPVARGETIAVLEAMKMENEIKCPVSGILSDLKVEAGNTVEKNVILFIIR